MSILGGMKGHALDLYEAIQRGNFDEMGRLEMCIRDRHGVVHKPVLAHHRIVLNLQYKSVWTVR